MVVAAHQEQPVQASRRHPTSAGTRGGHRRPTSQPLVKSVCAAVTGLVMADTLASALVLPLLGKDPVARGVPLAQVSLLTTAYLAAIAALLIPAGRLADRVGRRAVLAAGLGVFAAGALTMAFGSTWVLLLTGRLAQGVGAALMLPSAFGLLLGSVGQEQGRGAVALWGSATGIGGLIMHAFGGVMLQGFGWRSLYLPLGMAAAALLLLVPVLPRSRAERQLSLDLIGMTLMAAATVASVLVITCGGGWGWVSTPTVIAAVAALAGTGFVVWRSCRRSGRLLDGVLWRREGFGWGAFSSLLYGLVAFPILVLGPAVLREAGMSPAVVGFVLAPMSAVIILVSPFAARLTRRVGTTWAVYAGSFLSAAGCLALFFSGISSPWGVLALLVMGAGFAILTTSATISGTLAVGPHRYAEAVGTITTARTMGAAIGPAAALAYLTNATTPTATRTYEVLLGCMATVVLLAVCALVRAVRQRRLGEAGERAVGQTTADVTRLREALLRQRARFEAMARAAEDELAALSDPHRVRTAAPDARTSPSTVLSSLGGHT